MSDYLQKFSTVTGIGADINKLASVVGAENSSFVKKFSTVLPNVDIPLGAGAIAGAAAGAYLGRGRGHTILGLIVGGALGNNLPPLALRPELRTAALRNLVQVGGLAFGALAVRHRGVLGRAIGGAVGYLAASLAANYGGLK